VAGRIHGIATITEVLEICSIRSQDQVNVKGTGRGRVCDETDGTQWDGCWFTIGATDCPTLRRAKRSFPIRR